MLIFGGIPWNCYFQRVLSCRTPRDAQRPVDSGRRADDRLHRAAAADGNCGLRVSVAGRYRSPPPSDAGGRDAAAVRARGAAAVGMLGLAAIIGAVTSSFSSSILSAGSMLSWNCLKRLVWPSLSVVADGARHPIVDPAVRRAGDRPCAEGAERPGAVVLHERSRVRPAVSAAAVRALRPKANRIGSIAAFVVSLVLRVGGGEPLLGLPAFIPYPETLPFRTVAAAVGLVLLPVVVARHGAMGCAAAAAQRSARASARTRRR